MNGCLQCLAQQYSLVGNHETIWGESPFTVEISPFNWGITPHIEKLLYRKNLWYEGTLCIQGNPLSHNNNFKSSLYWEVKNPLSYFDRLFGFSPFIEEVNQLQLKYRSWTVSIFFLLLLMLLSCYLLQTNYFMKLTQSTIIIKLNII